MSKNSDTKKITHQPTFGKEDGDEDSSSDSESENTRGYDSASPVAQEATKSNNGNNDDVRRASRKRKFPQDPPFVEKTAVPNYVPLNKLTDDLNYLPWKICARVTEKVVKTFGIDGQGQLLSVVLVDKNGAMKATSWGHMADRFERELQEGEVYKINGGYIRSADTRYTTVKNRYELKLNEYTEVKLCKSDEEIPFENYTFNFTEIKDLQDLEKGTLVDVIGLIRRESEVEEVFSEIRSRMLKKREVSIADEKRRLTVTLWEKKAETFSGQPGSVLAVRGAYTTEFNDDDPITEDSDDFKIQYVSGIPASHKDREVYVHNTAPKGRALIFNNKKFTPHPETGIKLDDRDGTEKDVEKLKKILTGLGYVPKVKHDLKADEMTDVMIRFTKKRYHKSSCSVVVVVLSHGAEGTICGSNGVGIEVSDFISHLNGKSCPNLNGKPKLFFIQACRGKRIDKVPCNPADTYIRSDYLKEQVKEQVLNDQEVSDSREIARNIPTEADLFVAYATFEGYVAWRGQRRGSWFIQSLCQILAKYAASEDINSMMTRVNDMVARRTGAGGTKQIPVTQTALTKKLFFYPGYPVRYI